MRQNPIR